MDLRLAASRGEGKENREVVLGAHAFLGLVVSRLSVDRVGDLQRTVVGRKLCGERQRSCHPR